MASEFDFLRAKWPKLAAMAADASRLVDISPTSSMSSLRIYCEWAADIALDLYEIQVPGGASQIEKLEALQASGYVPAEILQKFHNIRSAGNRVTSDLTSGVDLANACLSDSRDIGQWLFREADKEGWPRNESYAPAYGKIPIEGMQDVQTPTDMMSNEFKMSKFMRKYGSYITLFLAAVVIVAAIVGITMAFNNRKAEQAPPSLELSNMPSITGTPAPVTAVPDTPTPTPAEDPFTYLEDIPIATPFSVGILNTHKWNYKSYQEPFHIGNTPYEHGIGMFIKSSDIGESEARQQASWNLDGKYTKMTFDLGADAKWSYGSRQERGTYRIYIYADGELVWETDESKTYRDIMEDMTVVFPENTLQLTIKLNQQKGDKGTLCVVMGDVKLYHVEEE